MAICINGDKPFKENVINQIMDTLPKSKDFTITSANLFGQIKASHSIISHQSIR